MNNLNSNPFYLQPELNDLSYKIIGCVFKVHRELGPGLLESSYEVCLAHELSKTELRYQRQKALPIEYDGVFHDAGYRVDLIVEDSIIVELKAVSSIAPIHQAQILSYLKLSGLRLGLLFNFNVVNMQSGIHRFIR